MTRRLDSDELRIWEYVTRQDARLPHASIDWSEAHAPATSPPSGVTGKPLQSSDIPRRATESQLDSLLKTAFTAAGEAHAPPPTHKGLDKNTHRRLRQGKLPIEATLDLHGSSREEARHLLTGFLHRAFDAQKRCVLVITGKGRFHAEQGRTDGILRQAVPQWLAQPPCSQWVLSHHHAQPQHGGEGAVYILLRRLR